MTLRDSIRFQFGQVPYNKILRKEQKYEKDVYHNNAEPYRRVS